MAEHPFTNAEIAAVLREIALLLDLDGVAFKPRAYEKAAQAVDASARNLRDLWAANGMKGLDDIPGMGKGIAGKVDELLRTGRIKILHDLRERFPVDVTTLMRVDGVGPKTVKTLWRELGVQTLDDLEKAAREGRLEQLPHFGRKSQEKVRKSVAFLRQGVGRVSVAQALRYCRPIERRLRELPHVQDCVIAGSMRRFRETIGDADFLVVSSQAESVIEAFTSMPEVTEVHARGTSTKASVRLANGMDADLRVVGAASFGAALLYFTGSKAHNVHLRRIAISKGYKLNEYGLYRSDDETLVVGRTEEEIYEALGLSYIPPELREDAGEIEDAAEGRLPRLIDPGEPRAARRARAVRRRGEHPARRHARHL